MISDLRIRCNRKTYELIYRDNGKKRRQVFHVLSLATEHFWNLYQRSQDRK